jgi:murein DD-endopeptidase MepM/ murein hydrolase activator NlpD
MRKHVHQNPARLARRLAAIVLVAGSAAGCSSGFTRFDQDLYSSTATPPPAGQTAAAQPYPGDVDPVSTSSIGPGWQHPVPAGEVGGYSGGQGTSDVYQQQASLQQSAQGQTYAPPPPQGSTIQRTNLASPVPGAQAYSKPPLLAPGNSAPGNSNIDPVQTSSAPAGSLQASAQSFAAAAAPAEPAKPQSAKVTGNERGWTATGGTSITLREGETLYNLSKRYGVPVKAILTANGIADANSVRAGQSIVIPTYVYSKNAPISAPDNDPNTLAASASRGSLGAAAPAVGDAPAAAVNAAAATAKATSGTVTVAAGDSLARIARENGVTVSALKAANDLSADNIRIGQVLKLPGAPVQTAAASPAKPTATDASPQSAVASTTAAQSGSQPKPQAETDSQKTASTGDLNAPARTGIEEFRWPVRGRVISNFGEKTDTGRNDGIDISVPEGTAVKAAENGVVVYAGDELEGLGNLVLIRHADGWVSAYAHNKQIDVKRGDEVKRGQTIARSGRTGSADMPMLHFELRKNSTPVDPIKHLGGA